MKAIILAGGKGRRAASLTDTVQKVMLPVMNRPLLSYSFELLKKHGIRDITLAVGEKSEQIQKQFGDGRQHGIRLRYLAENEPLGTAGCIKNAEWLLCEPFFVISGCLLTDADLSSIMRAHKETGADATLAVATKENPIGTVGVVCAANGHVLHIAEQHDWETTVTDRTLIGISVLNPEALRMIPSHRPYALSSLFSDMLSQGKTLRTYQVSGYFKSIETVDDYRDCHRDLFAHKLSLPSCATFPKNGVLVGENCMVDPSCSLSPYCVLGDNCTVLSGAKLTDCILWSGAVVENDTQLSQAIVTARSQGLPDAQGGAELFVQNALRGILHQDITPELLVRVAAAFSAALGEHPKILVSVPDEPPYLALKFALLSGLSAAGAQSYHLCDPHIPNAAKFAMRHLAADGAIVARLDQSALSVELLGEGGAPAKKEVLTSVMSALKANQSNLSQPEQTLPPINIQNITDYYIKDVLAHTTTKRLNFTVAVCCSSRLMRDNLKRIGSLLNIAFLFVNDPSLLDSVIQSQHPDFCMEISPDGKYHLFDDNGTRISEDLYHALCALICFSADSGGCIDMPTESSELLNSVARSFGGSILRVSRHEWEARLLSQNTPTSRLCHALCFDCIRAIVRLCEFLYLNNCSLSEVLCLLPSMHKISRYVACPKEKSAGIMRLIFERFSGMELEADGGISVHKDGGRILIFPDETTPRIRVFSENPSASFAVEAAEEFCSRLKRLIKE